ncbi:hypothetical protein N0B44_07230 [Roseibacterium beibuensis]|uniref:hypothetical protein n=1 Tax=[Roseibacterium] beibuensis TaxID=1193142 RepID=UPI00217EA9E6|nr:hypothetical protein [Roseibacterium beibuensis]MCS6622697.1 hypothetical protein [Roseibacterium beibuensis]
MLITAASAAALLLAAPQTAPQNTSPPPPPGADITSSLNSGPPRPADYLAPAPVVEPEPQPEAAPPAVAATPPAASAPAPARPVVASPPSDGDRYRMPEPFVAPPENQPSRVTPIPVAPSPAPRTAPITPPRTTPAAETPRPTETPAVTAPAPAPAAAPVAEAPPPPSVPAVTVLDAEARAALPFRVDLPAGFELVTGRPGPDFRIYTIRRGDRSFAMVYAGPASQFPIYSGEVLEAGGRATVVSTEDGVRHAREHLFLREGATPREVHVWTMSLDGADRALAERIAQSVDLR